MYRERTRECYLEKFWWSIIFFPWKLKFADWHENALRATGFLGYKTSREHPYIAYHIFVINVIYGCPYLQNCWEGRSNFLNAKKLIFRDFPRPFPSNPLLLVFFTLHNQFLQSKHFNFLIRFSQRDLNRRKTMKFIFPHSTFDLNV